MLKVEQWSIDKLIPYARNPRKNDEVVERMASAIKEFGFRIPIVARSDGSIVDGHLRLKAAKKLGMTDVPVALADELTDAQIKAFRLLANQSANWAEWDSELLRLELEDLKELDFDLNLTGFNPGELEEIAGIDDIVKSGEEKYTSKITTPLYEPTGKDVGLDECFDATWFETLLKHIDAAEISDKEKAFLRNAATRHIVFNYQNIAEYYASKASKQMQNLMEESALVVIDIDQAIENGYVRISENLKKIIQGQMENDEA